MKTVFQKVTIIYLPFRKIVMTQKSSHMRSITVLNWKLNCSIATERERKRERKGLVVGYTDGLYFFFFAFKTDGSLCGERKYLLTQLARYWWLPANDNTGIGECEQQCSLLSSDAPRTEGRQAAHTCTAISMDACARIAHYRQLLHFTPESPGTGNSMQMKKKVMMRTLCTKWGTKMSVVNLWGGRQVVCFVSCPALRCI